ncbi:hypothetical protein RclHR1_00050033 [Rhizophagus clarus]|uniref:Smr domain-containing protein n=1 Tax=Rhizophagus clarus TaxID=94130 RepID=A0A2Z6RXJ1_9GLOM|nr:hypothetical protein RclHR1_00050033 [Rhizophagus clarus]GES86197.1 hypothetical protein GLOIN_2v1554184 [Rhizophagus clarus]
MEDDIKLLRKNLGDDLKIKSPKDGHPKDPDYLIQIDFHGLTVEQTEPVLQRFKDSEKLLKKAACVRFITGHARSRETESKLKPLVSKFLNTNYRRAVGKKVDEKAKGHIDLIISRNNSQKNKNSTQSATSNESRKSQGAGKSFSRKSSAPLGNRVGRHYIDIV